MGNDWIFDVLTDLKTFASSNGLPALAEQLDDTLLVAATEVAVVEGRAPIIAGTEGDGVRRIHSDAAESANA